MPLQAKAAVRLLAEDAELEKVGIACACTSSGLFTGVIVLGVVVPGHSYASKLFRPVLPKNPFGATISTLCL